MKSKVIENLTLYIKYNIKKILLKNKLYIEQAHILYFKETYN